jgi:hypothetical protein
MVSIPTELYIYIYIYSSEIHYALRLRYVDLVQACIHAVGHHFQHFYKCTATFRMQICRKYLLIKLNGFRPVWKHMYITSNTFYKCTATFLMQICRKYLLIKLNGFRPVWTLMYITSNTFYKCTATVRTHWIYINIDRFTAAYLFGKISVTRRTYP